jgi:Mn-dependent DtxR family transcriptional regulator
VLDEVASIEAAEASIDAFIDRRAKQNEKVNAEEMVWKASVRKYHAKLDTERLWEHHGYHRAMLDAHTRNFEEILRRHRVGLRLCEEALGLPISEETGDAT